MYWITPSEKAKKANWSLTYISMPIFGVIIEKRTNTRAAGSAAAGVCRYIFFRLGRRNRKLTGVVALKRVWTNN